MSEESFWERFNEGQMDRRTFVKVASLLGGGMVFGLPLLGCQPAAPKQVYELKFAAPTAQITLMGIYSGDARGFYVQEGVKNVPTEFAGGADQSRAILTGGYDVGIVSPTAGMSPLEVGEPTRYIAGGYNFPVTAFVVRADSPFKKPEDLKGKKFKIGYSRPTSASHLLAYLGLKAIGIDPNDKNQVEFVSVGAAPDSWTAVRGGVVDVGWSIEPTITSVEVKGEGRLLWAAGDLVKDWTDQMVMTSQPFIDSHPKELKAWTAAYAKAIDWVKNNYSEAAKDLAQALGIEAAIAEAVLNRVPKEVWSASLPKKALENVAKTAVEFGLLKATPNWKVLINQSFLPENLRDPSWGV